MSCIYQKGMGKPGEADRNGPGWVWLPPCVVTLTPPLRPLCPMCRGMENFIFVSNQCQIISRNEARYTNNIGIKLPIAC